MNLKHIESKYIWLVIIATVVVAFDQITKMYIHHNFNLGDSVPVVPGYFNITYVRNLGAAFGFLGESHPTFRTVFFLAMPPIAMLIIFAILRGVSSADRLQVTALSLVFGGAIGNYIDRVRFRYVIDFLDFHLKEKYTWPAFNIADAAIVLGMIALVYIIIKEPQTETATDAPGN